MAAGTTRVFVVARTDSDHVVAYYAWTMAQIALAEAPARLRKGGGRYPQPVALLARLGVHCEHERKGLAAALLRDVISVRPRSATTSGVVDCSCTPSPTARSTSIAIWFPGSSRVRPTNSTSCCCSRMSDEHCSHPIDSPADRSVPAWFGRGPDCPNLGRGSGRLRCSLRVRI